MDRVKVLLAVRAVRELEAEALAGAAGRGGALRALAAGCAAEGLAEVAAELRARADELDRAGEPVPTPPRAPALPPGPAGPGGAGEPLS